MLFRKFLKFSEFYKVRILFRFDWMKNEPNDWEGQNCLTFVKDQVE